MNRKLLWLASGEKATFSDRHGMMYGVDRGRSSFFAHYFFSAIFRISAAVVAAILRLIILHTSPQFLLNLANRICGSIAYARRNKIEEVDSLQIHHYADHHP